MQPQQKPQEFIPLSSQLDMALCQEEYHPAELLRWQLVRHTLEQQIQNPIDQLSEIAERAFNDEPKN